MENKKSAMAELLDEFGYGFEKMEEEKQEELIEDVKEEEEKQVTPVVEEKKPEEPKDITIKCKKCENDFVWTVRDQEFYKEKGFFRPSYCKECRKKTKVVSNFHKDM